VYGIALQASGDPTTAATLTAQVYVAAWRSAPAFDALQGGPGGWLADLTEAKLTVVPGQGRRPRYATSRSLGLAGGGAKRGAANRTGRSKSVTRAGATVNRASLSADGIGRGRPHD
jgi:hypothetical protein